MKPQWIETGARGVDESVEQRAIERQQILTKPAGSLGQLEAVAVRMAGLQGSERPQVNDVQIVVFAADHGVAAEGVSLFPQAVTAEMIRNFARGGAAISVAARSLGARLEVVDVGAAVEIEPLPGVVRQRVADGTENLAHRAAMSERQLVEALEAGRQAVDRASTRGVQLFIGGEMGIANTTSAAALACSILDEMPERLAGPGTGFDEAGVRHKADVIKRALGTHAHAAGDAWESLRCLGGFEIAALVGAYLSCAQRGIPVLVDGYICISAALVAQRLQPSVEPWLLYAHTSAEPEYARIAQALQIDPLLNLGMRLGEGSGAAVTVPLIRMACALHNEMATFAEAGVSESNA